MEHYVAIDNVCAWPNLTLLPDGNIAAIIYDQPHHAGWEGDVVCCVSEDSGRLWKLRSKVTKHQPSTNRMNVAAGLSNDGSFIVISSGYTNRVPPGTDTSHQQLKGSVLPSLVYRSTDYGISWEVIGAEIKGDDDSPYYIPYGDIIQLSDNRLGVSFYCKGRAFFFVSEDKGESWKKISKITDCGTETALLSLAENKIIAVTRTTESENPNALDLYTSFDEGKTWQFSRHLTLPGQHPAHLLLSNENAILLTYGVRNYKDWGISCRISKDNGQNWSHPLRLFHLEQGSPDSGYPSAVILKDGTLVVAYYASTSKWHNRYHMGVIRLNINDDRFFKWYLTEK